MIDSGLAKDTDCYSTTEMYCSWYLWAPLFTGCVPRELPLPTLASGSHFETYTQDSTTWSRLLQRRPGSTTPSSPFSCLLGEAEKCPPARPTGRPEQNMADERKNTSLMSVAQGFMVINPSLYER